MVVSHNNDQVETARISLDRLIKKVLTQSLISYASSLFQDQ